MAPFRKTFSIGSGFHASSNQYNNHDESGGGVQEVAGPEGLGVETAASSSKV